MDDLLKYAVEHGMIDLSYVKEQIAMNQRKELLAKHPYKIWEGKDGKCYTYFPDKEKGRILKKKSSKESIDFENFLKNFPPGLKRGFFDTPHPFHNLAWNSEIRFLKICVKNPVQILFKFPRNPIC